PCLLGYIDKCAAPCVGRVSAQRHREIVADFCDFLSGKTDRFARDLERQMSVAAAELDFERAARLRDDLGALKRALEKQAVVLGDGTDADVVAFADDPLEAAVQVFHVRGGRVRGQRGWIVEKPGEPGESAEAALVEQFLTQFYGAEAELGGPGAELGGPPGAELGGAADESSNPVPREVLVPCLPPNAAELACWLSSLRGSRVVLRVPRRGDKRALAETVHRNAREALQQHKLKRAGDFTARSAALHNIQESLGLAEAPLRIECIDISHVQGTDVVGSLVVFEDGLPRKSDYRHFAIREAAGQGRSDDVASIAEITRRRFLRHVRETGCDGADPDIGKRRFAYPPNLFVVDGGVPQVNAARAVLDELGVTDVAVIGLAKRLEEVWVPGEPDPVVLPRNSEGLYLLQRVRDEAHRFAISYHRSKRSKRMTASALDDVRGLGEARRKALVTHFGSVARLRAATVAEITEVPGIGATTAAAVLAALGGQQTAAPVEVVGQDAQQAL
ncbi:MAG: excinuclease ABC subunit UvrC, partial [Mycobacterium sp.]|nr:excinuclease ABC subunit UvrC [Mycobacterium sp.]